MTAIKESDVLPYLLGRGLVSEEAIVDGDVRVVDASRRNCNFRVLREGDASYLLKKGTGDPANATTAREALVYDVLSQVPGTRGPRGIGTFLPRVELFDAGESILVLELFPAAEDLRQHHRRLGRFPVSVAAAVGRALGLLHAPEVAEAARRSAPELLAPEPAGFQFHRPGLPLLSEFSGGCIELVRLIQRTDGVGELLDALPASWRTDAFIHQDARWDNVIVVVPRSEIKLVDWETAGLGDRAWDVGALFADYVGCWVSSIPSGGSGPDGKSEGYLALARHPLGSVQPAIRACWKAYLGSARLDDEAASPLLERAARFAGLKLMHAALEHVQTQSEAGSTAVSLLQVGVNMLRWPEQAASVLLGIKGAAQ